MEYTQLQDRLAHPHEFKKILVQDTSSGHIYPDLRLLDTKVNEALGFVVEAFLFQTMDGIGNYNQLLECAVEACQGVICITPLLLLARSLTLDHHTNGKIIKGPKNPARAKELLLRVLKMLPDCRVNNFSAKEADLLDAHDLAVITLD